LQFYSEPTFDDHHGLGHLAVLTTHSNDPLRHSLFLFSCPHRHFFTHIPAYDRIDLCLLAATARLAALHEDFAFPTLGETCRGRSFLHRYCSLVQAKHTFISCTYQALHSGGHINHGRVCPAAVCTPDLPRPLATGTSPELLSFGKGRCLLYDLRLQRFAHQEIHLCYHV
jgi:hypothetical protein